MTIRLVCASTVTAIGLACSSTAFARVVVYMPAAVVYAPPPRPVYYSVPVNPVYVVAPPPVPLPVAVPVAATVTAPKPVPQIPPSSSPRRPTTRSCPPRGDLRPARHDDAALGALGVSLSAVPVTTQAVESA